MWTSTVTLHLPHLTSLLRSQARKKGRLPLSGP